MSEPTPPTRVDFISLDEFPAVFSSILDDDFCGLMVKCCVFTLNRLNHSSGILLKSNTGKGNLFMQPVRLDWKMPVTKQMKNTFQDENRTTDFAAMCVSLHLVQLLTDYRYVFPSRLGSGVDFWLTNDETGLTWDARLEVSGIKKETTANTIPRRVRDKRKQVEKSIVLQKSAYIAVVEFSNPEAIFLKQ